MNTKEYNDREYLKQKRVECLKAKDKIKIRYYLWDWCFSYGWKQIEKMSGWKTIEELKKDCKWNFENADNWKILKAEVIEEKKLD